MPHTTHQHYVPEFLLKRFSTNGKEIYEWDRRKNQIRRKDANSSCVVNDLYEEKWNAANPRLDKYVLDNQLEKYFTELEGRTATLFRKIDHEILIGSDKVVLNEAESKLLTEFITTLYLRNPLFLTWNKKYYQGVDEEPQVKPVIELVEELFDKSGLGSAQSLIKHSITLTAFSKEIEGSPYNVEYNMIKEMRPLYWYSEDSLFVTSSFPLQFVVSDSKQYDRILLPISSHVAIVLFRELPFLTEEGMVLKPGRIGIINNMKLFLGKFFSDFARFVIGESEDVIKIYMK